MKKFIKILLPIVLLAGLAWGVLNWQFLYDEWRLRGYSPPPEISQLANQTTMTDEAKRLFYVNHPELLGKKRFNKECHLGERTIVLGCFNASSGIFILRVKDERLDGIEEVTVAHEMLHAAYGRLSSDERAKVDRLTSEAFDGLNDKRIRKTISQYRADDPSVVANELHSILGTEVRSLGPELESYYRQYFNDRAKVVDFADRYQSEFELRRERSDNLLRRMRSIQQQIEDRESRINGLKALLDSESARLEAERGTTDDPAGFNAQVQDYNALAAEFNALVDSRNRLASQYNDLVRQYNRLAVEERQLINAIDSRAPSR